MFLVSEFYAQLVLVYEKFGQDMQQIVERFQLRTQSDLLKMDGIEKCVITPFHHVNRPTDNRRV